MPVTRRGPYDLLPSICWEGIECLNQRTCFPLENALAEKYRDIEELVLGSDLDEQLLIRIPFYQAVNLHAIDIMGQHINEGPKTVKLYSNREHMTFSDIDQYTPSETIHLSPKDLTWNPYVLQCAKFQTVRSLGIFVEDNQSGSDVTYIQKICLYGSIADMDGYIQCMRFVHGLLNCKV